MNVRRVVRAGFSSWILAMILFVVSTSAQAQQTAGIIRGRVVDEAGQPIAGVRVVARGDALAPREAIVDATGRYVLSGLPSGTYTVHVEGQGYRSEEHEDINVGAGATVLDVALAENVVAIAGVEVVARRRYAARNSAMATRMELPLLDVPQSVQVITKDFLEDQDATRLADVFRNVSGVNAFSPYEDYTIRGFRIQEVLYNGQRAPTSNFFSPARTATVERVEVLKGPAGVLYGSFEPGGVVNLVTERPEATPARTVSVSLGSYDRRELEADITGPFGEGGNVLYRMSALVSDQGSFRPHEDSRSVQLAPSVTWLVGDRTTLRLNAEFVDNHHGYNRGIPAPEGDVNRVPVTWTLTEPGDFVDHRGYSVEAGADQALGTAWTLRGGVRFADTDTRQWSHDRGGLLEVDGRLQLARRFYDYPWATRFVTPSASLAGEFSTGTIQHTVLLGSDARFYSLVSRNRTASDGVPPLDLDNPEYGHGSPETYTFSTALWTDDARFVSAFAQDLVELHPRLKVLLGARYDHFRDHLTWDEEGYQVDEVVREGAVSLRAGAVVQPRENVSLYGSYSQGFNAENLAWAQPDGGPYDAERSHQWEVGARGEWFGGRLASTVAAYRIRKTDILVEDPDSELFRYIPIGEVESEGVELDLTGAITPDWSVVANYSFNEIAITDDTDESLIGKPLPNAPKHAAGLWTRFDFAGTGLGVGGGLSYVDERATFSDNTTIPSYTLADLAAYYDLEGFRFALKVNNLFDRKHFIGAYDETTVFPGWPRTVSFRASYDF